MARFGDYETTQELSARGRTTVYLGRRVAGSGAPAAAVKVLQLPGGGGGAAHAATAPAGGAPDRTGAGHHDVFISHSAHDKAAADAVCGALEAAGVRCWIAPRNILPGSNWASAILKAIADSRIVVLIFSSYANTSPHIRREVERAVHHGIPVAPIRVEDVMPVDDMEYFLGTSHWTDAVAQPFEQHLPRLVADAQALMAATGKALRSPAPAAGPVGGPPAPAAAAVLDAARAQQQVARRSPHWAPVHDAGEVPHGAYCATDPYPQSAERLADNRVLLGPAELHALVDEVVQGLIDLERVLGRPHGNLKPSNVLLADDRPGAAGAVALTDPLPPAKVTPAGYAADLDALSRLIASLGTGQALGGGSPLPAARPAEWARFGRAAGGWRELYDLLRTLRPTDGAGLAQVQERLAALAPRPRSRRWPVGLAAAAGVAAVAAAAPLAYRAALLNRTPGDGQAFVAQNSSAQADSRPAEAGRSGTSTTARPATGRTGEPGGPDRPATAAAGPAVTAATAGPVETLMAATNPGSGLKVRLAANVQPCEREGGQCVAFTVTSDRECFVMLIGQDSAGDVGLLLPNPDAKECLRLPAGESAVPSAGAAYDFPVTPPYGRTKLKVIATTRRIDVLREPVPATAADPGGPLGNVQGLAVDGKAVDAADLSAALGKDGWATAEVELMTGPDPKVQ